MEIGLAQAVKPLSALSAYIVNGHLYAILDACDTPVVPERLSHQPASSISLYCDRTEKDNWAFAPYLTRVDEPLLNWIEETLWQDPWGIFVISDSAFETVRSHVTRFLIVESPESETLYFRFYDPRILPRFLAACTRPELRELFGPISAFGVAQQVKDEITVLSYPRAESDPNSAGARRSEAKFRLRDAHLRAFETEADAAFRVRVLAYLRREHREAIGDFPDDLQPEVVDTGLERARRYGLSGEVSLAAFIGLMLEVAPNFDEHPSIRSLLSNPTFPPEERLALLRRRVSAQTWEEAAARYDIGAWFSGHKEMSRNAS